MAEKVCGDCKFHLKRGVCPRAEYKDYERNLIACSSTDKACELFQSKRKQKKKNNDEEKNKIKYSPGFLRDSVIFEQIDDLNYVHGKALEESPVFPLGDVTYQPLPRCPWPLATKAEQFKDFSALWKEVKQFIYDHLFLPSSELYDVLTAWTFSTWICELWPVVPYVFFYGPVASGKTRGLETLRSLSYRGILASNISPAALFRASEEWHPTLFLDETEIYSKDTKIEVIGLLNSGYRRGQYAIRVKQTQHGSELEAFDVFGFKALAGTHGLAQALESRSIMIRMIKARREVVRVLDEKRATEIRNKLLGWRLYTLTSGEHGELSELFLEVGGRVNFADGRLSELFSCLLAVSNNGRENILKYAQKLHEIRSLEEKASEEAEIIQILSKNDLYKDKGIVLTKDITEAFNSSRNEKEGWKTRSVGYLVRRLGFDKVHTKQGNGWLIDQDRLAYLQEIYDVKEEEPIPPSESVHQVHQVHPIDEMFPEKHNGKYPICYICHEPIPLLQNLSNIEGRPAHKHCIAELERGKREGTS